MLDQVVTDEKTLQSQFDEFYEDVFEELSNFGEIEELNVIDNIADHLVGNVYAKFHKEEQASEALLKLQGRFYGGTCFLVTTTGYRRVTSPIAS